MGLQAKWIGFKPVGAWEVDGIIYVNTIARQRKQFCLEKEMLWRIGGNIIKSN